MDAKSLSRLLESPEIHKRLLAGYTGPYSLGVGRAPGRGDAAAVILHVQACTAAMFPDHVDLDGDAVPVLVRGGFVAPSPYRANKAVTR